MVGQIRSYISYIGVDSDQSYLDRIRKMIDDVPSDTDKATLLLEYTNKVNQINIMKKYIEEKKTTVVEEPQVIVPEPEEDEPLVKVKTFEEEMEEKIREYQEYHEDEEKNEEYLPDIYTNAYNLVKIGTTKIKLYKKMPEIIKQAKEKVKKIVKNIPRSIPKANFNRIPTLPIIED